MEEIVDLETLYRKLREIRNCLVHNKEDNDFVNEKLKEVNLYYQRCKESKSICDNEKNYILPQFFEISEINYNLVPLFLTMFERFQARLKHYYQSYKKSSINENLILTGIASADLHGSLSKLLNAKYLEDAQEKQQKLYTGVRFKQGRLMFSLPTKIKNKTKNVIYLLDTSSPFNYLCEEAITAFKVEVPTAIFAVSISGINCDALVSGIITHFSEMNILGSDFLQKSKATLNFDFEKDMFKIHLR